MDFNDFETTTATEVDFDLVVPDDLTVDALSFDYLGDGQFSVSQPRGSEERKIVYSAKEIIETRRRVHSGLLSISYLNSGAKTLPLEVIEQSASRRVRELVENKMELELLNGSHLAGMPEVYALYCYYYNQSVESLRSEA